MRIARYGNDGTLIETRDVAELGTSAGEQTLPLDPPLVCEAGDYIAFIHDETADKRP